MSFERLPTDGELIPTPTLDGRNEAEMAAQAIHRISGSLSPAIIRSQIEAREHLLTLIESGAVSEPICPELTNANPTSDHTALIEGLCVTLGYQAYAIDQVPDKHRIEFARLFGITLREATQASALLRFTANAEPGVNVTIPEGTRVSTQDEKDVYIFETIAEASRVGSGTIDVAVQRTVAGPTTLAPNTLTNLVDNIAFVTAVTNLAAIDSGTAKETVAEAMDRMRRFQLRGERWVTTTDLESGILDEGLRGYGIVKAFPKVVDGHFDAPLQAGHTTVIVMTRTGEPISDSRLHQSVLNLTEQAVGNQWIYVKEPIYVEFSVEADVRLISNVTASKVRDEIEKRLRDFYAPGLNNFGRAITRAEIAFVIEGTPGVDRIISPPTGPVFVLPDEDIDVQAWELPKLVTVTLNIVA